MAPWDYAQEYNTTGDGLTNNMTSIEGTVDAVHNDVVGRDAIITFTTNGVHGEGSLHGEGNAIDLRTRDMTEEQRNEVTETLRNELGDDYDVIDEGDHIHIEYDPPEQNNQQNQDEQQNDENDNNQQNQQDRNNPPNHDDEQG